MAWPENNLNPGTTLSKTPISAVVVSRNEGSLLSDCLASLAFCDEIIVYDLESTDNTATIAWQNRAKLIPHPVVPVVEEIRVEAAEICKHRWMLFLDPDERISPSLAEQLTAFIASPDLTCGVVTVPWIFYFKRKRLKGTMWGMKRFRSVLFNRDGITLTPDVHFGTRLNAGFVECSVGDFEGANVTHYWSDSLGTLIAKHRRYVKKEGSSKYNNGDRYPGAYRHFRTSLTAFYASYFYYKGYKDGPDGLFLSLLWSWYTFASLNSLRRYEKTVAGVK
jgi:glycosyltransferase involved in cell wall biosynthesis